MDDRNMFSSALDGIVKAAEKNNPVNACDYIGDDGFLYCGKCNTRKQCEVSWFDGRVNKVPALCRCESEKEEQEKLRREQVKKLEMIASLKRESLMDDKFRKCSFDTAIRSESNNRQLNMCRRYAEKFSEMCSRNQGLLLYGNVGTGKTFAACCIGNYLMENLIPVFGTSIVKILQSKFSMSSDHFDVLMSKINAADLLIIDDLGAERSTEYAVETVYNIIDCRYRVGKPMIVTTNLSLDEMKNCPDVRCRRIYDRVLEVCYPIFFDGKSLRIKDARNRYNEMKQLLEG